MAGGGEDRGRNLQCLPLNPEFSTSAPVTLAFWPKQTSMPVPSPGECRCEALLESKLNLGAGPRPLPQAPARRGAAVFSIMAVEEVIETEGKITSVLAGTMFRVELANQHSVLAHISGKMRKRFIRLTNGDRVKLEMSPYDLNKARIVYRLG